VPRLSKTHPPEADEWRVIFGITPMKYGIFKKPSAKADKTAKTKALPTTFVGSKW
jgi:hypothetical protein